MLNESDLTDSQQELITDLYDRDSALVVAVMGSGKSVATLTAIRELLQDGFVTRVLIVAPLKVCESVWAHEHRKWSHLTGVSVALCIGTPAERLRALREKAQITVVNYEGLPWMFGAGQASGSFDGLILDEITRIKGGGAQYKVLKREIGRGGFRWQVGLSGTPVSESFQGLDRIMVGVDAGARLGRNHDKYLREYFHGDYSGFNHTLAADGAERIMYKVRDVVLSMADYRSELPEIVYRYRELEMPVEVQAVYDRMRRDNVVTVDGNSIEAPNMAVMFGKLSQICNGFIYCEDPQTAENIALPISDYKITAVQDLVAEHSGANIIIVYQYQYDRERLLDSVEGCYTLDEPGAVDRFNSEGGGGVLLIHPKSAGHGLSLIGGSVMIWLGGIFSRDQYSQCCARIWRRGQTRECVIEHVLAGDSIDGLMRERVEDKAEFERLFARYLKTG